MNEIAHKIRVQLVDARALVRDALARLIASTAGIEVIPTPLAIEEAASHAAALRPDVVLLSLTEEAAALEQAVEILGRAPQVKLVVLDSRVRDANVRDALRIGAVGYLTEQQPFHQIEAALRRAAAGAKVFVPEIGHRLEFSVEGLRLPIDASELPLSTLSPRELDVIVLLAQGYSVKECAKTLRIGVSTAGNHKSRLMKKLDVHKTVELTHLAIRAGLVPLANASARRDARAPQRRLYRPNGYAPRETVRSPAAPRGHRPSGLTVERSTSSTSV